MKLLGNGRKPPASYHGFHQPNRRLLSVVLISCSSVIQSANIGLSKDCMVAKLLDYGLAHAISRRSATIDITRGQSKGTSSPPHTLGIHTMTKSASVLGGTHEYMAYEALSGKYGAQSEIYSFGIVLLELLTGKPASSYSREDIEDATSDGEKADGLADWLDATLAPLPDGIKGPLLKLVNNCVRRRADKRPKLMRDVMMSLKQIRDQAVAHLPPLPLAHTIDGEIESIDGQMRMLAERKAAMVGQRNVTGGQGSGALQANCIVCLTDSSESGGLRCRRELGLGHFICHECLQGYVEAEVTVGRLIMNRGTIVCPYRGGADLRDACNSLGWEVTHLSTCLESQTKDLYMAGVVHMFRYTINYLASRRRTRVRPINGIQ